MAITVADNFSYQGKKPLDGRDTFATLAAMKAYAEASVYDGCLSYCDEDGKRYEFKSTNTVDPTTGKWREYSSGGGGQTYNDFTGATASTAGAHGLVPAPSAGDEGKVLFGNGAWGALPNVDLSVLSNEAFIFSADEKPVGMAKNGKLLYAKTINLSASDVNLDDNNNIGLSGINIELAYGTVYMADGAITPLPYLNPAGLNNCAGFFFTSNLYLGLRFGTSQRNVSTITMYIFYTKTTDSALPSDVKFAGVTAGGDIVLKKTVSTGGSVPSGGTLLYRLPLLNGTDVVYYTT